MKQYLTASLTVLLCLFMFISPLQADVICDAQALYEKIDAETAGDLSRCDIQIKDPNIKDCPLPKTFTGGERPASHVVLLIDASGSMGAKLAGKSKMSIAKRESLRFLEALQKDVPVGMIVYGHKGNNTKKGKAESCASVEWVHKLGAVKSDLKKSIKALKPVGYTPMGDALDYTLAELQKVPKTKKDKESVPIVYLLSDGKETCGADPVASAKALHESGVRAIVNVIGFDVGKETRAQLEAISEAGGGKYFPAKDAKALRKQLNAAHDTERSLLHYKSCRYSNVAEVSKVHLRASSDNYACFQNEVTRPFNQLSKNLRAMVAAGSIDKECAENTRLIAYGPTARAGKWLKIEEEKIQAHQDIAMEKLNADSILKAFKKQ